MKLLPNKKKTPYIFIINFHYMREAKNKSQKIRRANLQILPAPAWALVDFQSISCLGIDHQIWEQAVWIP